MSALLHRLLLVLLAFTSTVHSFRWRRSMDLEAGNICNVVLKDGTVA